jgi:hypothetical protein
MNIAKTAATWLLTQIRKELTIQKVPRKSAREQIQENKILRTGLNGFAMLLLITVAMAVLIL